MADEKMKILVVDDEPNNITVIREVLKDFYNIAPAPSGAKALQIVGKLLPDLILLDIMMPGMDGFEVCRQLKGNPDTSEIPVIFVTAMNEVQNEAEGFEVGCVDYIRKPVQPDILKARVAAQLAVVEKDRLKEDVERITRHDLKTPLNAIIAYPQLMQADDNLTDKQHRYLANIEESGKKMLKMINLSLDLYKMEKGTYEVNIQDVDLLDIFKGIISENRALLKSKQSNINVQINGNPHAKDEELLVHGEKLLLYSMFANLLKNAIEASPKKEEVVIAIEDGECRSVSIHNHGAVPEEMRDTFFDKYATAGKSGGTGLGTYSARLIAETLGGNIKLDTSDENGTTIHIKFS